MTKLNMKYLFVIVCALLMINCSSSKKVATREITKSTMSSDSELSMVKNMMIGSYDSSDQERNDSSYYNISLHMYPIWEGNSDDAHYLYVEQAMAAYQDRPYRQRVYKLEKLEDGRIASHVYTLENDSLYIGKWQDPSFFDNVSTEVLKEREGCAVYLSKTANGYKGSTLEDHCKSTLRGASYATSIVQIDQNGVTSWDQGFDADGKQVWGAVKGPYIFKKIKSE